MAQSDSRNFDRTAVELTVTVTTEDGSKFSGTTYDVGMGGFSLMCESPLPIGSRCHALLTLGGGESAIRMETSAQVVWTSDSYIGVAFMDTDPENYKKIRDLFLYNPVSAGWD